MGKPYFQSDLTVPKITPRIQPTTKAPAINCSLPDEAYELRRWLSEQIVKAVEEGLLILSQCALPLMNQVATFGIRDLGLSRQLITKSLKVPR